MNLDCYVANEVIKYFIFGKKTRGDMLAALRK